MAWNQSEIPYNNLPNLPPAIDVVTTAVLKKAIMASRSLAELKGSCLRLPRPEILLNTIILQESKDSSAIENIVTTQDALYQAILNPTDRMPSEVKEVLRYREALYLGITELEQTPVLKASMTVKIMQRLRGITGAGYRSLLGTTLSNPATRTVIYTPPEPEYIQNKMNEWERFVNLDEQFDPLIKMALMHYQFEAIHPFSDGNGRTGRILNVLYLMQQGLITQPILYHSSYIIQHKSEYYRTLREVTEHDKWEPWILFMLDAIAETSQNTLRFIEQMLLLKEEMLRAIRKISQKMPAYELNELLFSYPYVKVKTLIDQGLGTRPTVSNYLDQLSQQGLLIVLKVGRENYYVNHQLMNLLTGAAK